MQQLYSDTPSFSLYDLCLTVLKSLFIGLLIISSAPSLAENGIKTEQLKNHTALLDKIEQKLKSGLFDENDLPEAIKQVTPVKSAAMHCVDNETPRLAKLKADLATLGKSSEREATDVKQKRLDIARESAKIEQNLASCRVLILRGEEVISRLSVAQQKFLAARLLAQGPDIKKLLKENWSKPSLWMASTKSFLTNNIGLKLFSGSGLFILIFIIITAVGVGIILRQAIVTRVRKKTPTEAFSNHFLRALLAVFGHYMPHLVMSISVAIYCYVITSTVTPVPFISVIAYGLPIYFILKAFIEIFLDPRLPAQPFHGIPEDASRALARRLKLLVLLIFIGYLLFTTLLSQSLPEATYLLTRGLFATIFFCNIIWAVWILGRIPRFSETLALRMGISLTLISMLAIEFMGYRNLSAYITRSLLSTLLLFGGALLASRLLCELFDGLDQGGRKWQVSVRKALGVKSSRKLPGLTWFRFIIGVGLWFGFVIAILKVWGLSDAGFQQLKLIAIEGFTLGSLKVIPARILLALIVLAILLAISSWFRARLEQSWLSRTGMERGAREALVTISGYVGIAIAFIIALSIAGFEFGNLAIIAGALSVGIGFGLQNIVNNFISGLILLFERPVKTGDWIIVGGTEGYVKRISIRSTQIQTFDRADVIVPNSELISGQVTNWMLRDIRGRIRVPVGVAYGSDTKLVHNLLLEVARQNPLVVTDGSSPEPKVLFMEFGDSALLFELRIFIQNIDNKYQATSDLNFAIDAAFRENNIQIPFPQRDLHIKNSSNDSQNGMSDESDQE